MKFFFILFFLLSSFSHASELKILNNFDTLYASSYMSYFHDVNNSFDISDRDKVIWHPVKSSNLSGAKLYPSWTRFELENHSNIPQDIFLKNPRAGMDEVDAYVMRKDSTTIYRLGDARAINLRVIQQRNSVIELTLAPHEKILILTRLVNRIGSTEGEWIVYPKQNFYKYETFESVWWGVFTGVIIALLLYAMPILMAAKDVYMVFYFTLYAVSSLFYQFAVNGFLYLIGIEPAFINHIVLFFAVSFGMFGILFILRFLQIENHRGIIYWAMIFFSVLLGSEYILLFVSLFSDKIMGIVGTTNVYIGLFAYVVWLAMIRDIIKITKDRVFRYLFIGYTIVILAYALQALVSAGLIQISIVSIYGVSAATLFETVFFVFGISEYINTLKRDQKKKEKLIDFQMRFASIGKVIGNISHQWKVPLVRSGMLITQIETTVQFKKESLAEVLVDIIPQMRANLAFMQNTVDEFYHLYSSQAKTEIFLLHTSVMEIWSMLHAKSLKFNAKITIDVVDKFSIQSYSHSFDHVVMILIDNMLNIADERKIKSPMITVTIRGSQKRAIITFEDNCEGIAQRPIESIFEIDISSKSAETGGMGLAMAKMIVEEKLKGDIRVTNGHDGTIFTITLSSL